MHPLQPLATPMVYTAFIRLNVVDTAAWPIKILYALRPSVRCPVTRERIDKLTKATVWQVSDVTHLSQKGQLKVMSQIRKRANTRYLSQ